LIDTVSPEGEQHVIASRVDNPVMLREGSEEKVLWQIGEWTARRAAMGIA
jgi:hypothetical protein